MIKGVLFLSGCSVETSQGEGTELHSGGRPQAFEPLELTEFGDHGGFALTYGGPGGGFVPPGDLTGEVDPPSLIFLVSKAEL